MVGLIDGAFDCGVSAAIMGTTVVSHGNNRQTECATQLTLSEWAGHTNLMSTIYCTQWVRFSKFTENLLLLQVLVRSCYHDR